MKLKKMMMKYLIIFVGLLCFGNSYAQTKSTIEKDVYELLKSDLKNSTLLNKILNETNQLEVCRSVSKYFADSTQKNRVVGFSLVKQLGKKHKALNEQTAQVGALFAALEFLSINDSKPVFAQLMTYPKACFKEDQIGLVRDYLALPKVERKEPMLLLGFVGEHDDIDYLQAMTMLYPLKKDDQFYLSLALIRLGDTEAKSNYLTKMETLKIEDEFVINNLKNAIYTHNTDVYRRLLKEVLEEACNCSSANNDDPTKIPCAYRIIEALAPVVKDFPVRINRIGEIDGDPREALQAARDWITIHLQDFQINTSIY